MVISGKDVDDINRILRYLIKYQIEKKYHSKNILSGKSGIFVKHQ